MASNLYDSYILQDAAVFLKDYGLIGMCPSITTPAINIQTEAYRGAGMDGEVEIPMGIEKIEWEFDMFTYDPTVWSMIGFGPGSMTQQVSFVGYLQTPSGGENEVFIQTSSLIKSIKTGKFEPGKKTDVTVMMNCSQYKHTIGDDVVLDINLFNKRFNRIGGQNNGDVNQTARTYLGIS